MFFTLIFTEPNGALFSSCLSAVNLSMLAHIQLLQVKQNPKQQIEIYVNQVSVNASLFHLYFYVF